MDPIDALEKHLRAGPRLGIYSTAEKSGIRPKIPKFLPSSTGFRLSQHFRHHQFRLRDKIGKFFHHSKGLQAKSQGIPSRQGQK